MPSLRSPLPSRRPSCFEEMKLFFRGGNLALIESKEHEAICCGPADTGKSFAGCVKSHMICSMVPGAQGAIVRKTAASLTGSVIPTFNRIIKGSPVQIFGGETPSRYIYPNGSKIWLGGMDNPNRILSSERDFIYVCQAEELTLDDWEMLLTRCTGRGAVVAHTQLFGDCNPAGTMHWIRQRAKEGRLRLINTTHKDNPELYDDDGWLTAEGKRRIDKLKASLTGIRRKRLLEGIWATAEGAVYDNFDPNIHVTVKDPNDYIRFKLAMDEGFTNPQVCLLIGEDGDKRWHVFKEYYVTGQLETTIVAQAAGWFSDVRSALPDLRGRLPVRCEKCAVDNAAPGLIAALNAAGVYAIGGKGALTDSTWATSRGMISGISKIQVRLAVAKDGKPRLTVDPSCVNTINEFESYVWKEGKDVPEDENNHSMGALRYLEDVEAQDTGAFSSSGQIVKTEPAFERMELDTERINFDSE